MSRKRNKSTGTSARTCDKCELSHPSTVEGTRHRRCGGKPGAPIRPKHSIADVRGFWR